MKNPLVLKHAADTLKFIFNFSAKKELPPTEVLVFEDNSSNEYKTKIVIDLSNYCDDDISVDKTEEEKQQKQFEADVRYFLDVLDSIGAFDQVADRLGDPEDMTKMLSHEVATAFFTGSDVISNCGDVIGYNHEHEINGQESTRSIEILTHLSISDILTVLDQEIPTYARGKADAAMKAAIG